MHLAGSTMHGGVHVGGGLQTGHLHANSCMHEHTKGLCQA